MFHLTYPQVAGHLAVRLGRLRFSAYLKYEETIFTPPNMVIHATLPQTFLRLGAFTYTMPHNHKFSDMATFSVEGGFFQKDTKKMPPKII